MQKQNILELVQNAKDARSIFGTANAPTGIAEIFKRIELSVRATYVPSWGLYEGIRELLQNARDAEVLNGSPMKVDHDPTTNVLYIRTKGSTIDVRSLLLGFTTKAGDIRAAGQYGEGMKLAMLALARAGHHVSVYSGDQLWNPCIVESAQFGGEKVLAVDVRECASKGQQTTVCVGGVSAESWAEIEECFLFLSKKAKRIEAHYGALLTEPKYAGKIYVKGIFVQKLDELRYGYDLKDVNVDRDRRMVDIGQARYRCSDILSDVAATKRDVADGLYENLKGRKADGAVLAAYAPKKTVDAVVARFNREFGKTAVAVENESQADKIRYHGGRAVVVSPELRAFVEQKKGSFLTVLAKLKNDVDKTYSRSTLKKAELSVLERCERIVSNATGHNILATVVDFADNDNRVTAGRHSAGKIMISRKLLTDMPEALATLVHEAAHMITGAGDGDTRHTAMIEKLWKTIYVMATSEGMR